MASAMFGERGMRKKLSQEDKPTKKAAPKRKSNPKTAARAEQNNNVKRQRLSVDSKEDMLANYQPWVIQTYGDLAKTKTITIKKYARILRTLRGEEVVSADNSKFRFWVKAKGFYVGKPPGYDAKPADAIIGRYSVCDADEGIPAVDEKLNGSAKDPPLYVPNAPFKNCTGEPVYRKVAVVENFFDIIYNVHVELEGRPGKHAGQKRTYRTITETYAFLPREAVTRFLLGCTECQKHPRSPSPVSVLPTPSPSPTLPLVPTTAPVLSLATCPQTAVPHQAVPPQLPPHIPPPAVADCQPEISYLDFTKPVKPLECKSPTPNCVSVNISPQSESLDLSHRNSDISQSQTKIEGPLRTSTPEPKRSSNPLDVCNLTSRDPPKTPPKKRHQNHLSDNSYLPVPATPKLWSPVEGIEKEQSQKRRMLMAGDIDYSLPITTTYLKYMRSLGCADEDALKFEGKTVSFLIENFLHDTISHYFYKF